jgi:hypothetical protein
MRRLLPLLLLAGCGAAGALDRMKDADARGDWAALAAATVPACQGPADPICAESHALRARGCARMADAPGLSETARRGLRDCAVESGAAALAAAGATPADRRAGWRLAHASALFARRQASPGEAACADNAALLLAAERLRAELPEEPRPRFLAASARLTALTRGCGPATGCAGLATARALLRDPPPDAAAQWGALGAGIALTARRLGCPT